MDDSVVNLNQYFDDFSRVLAKCITSSPVSHSSILSNDDESFEKDKGMIISIDGKWGSGKTTFINYFIKNSITNDENVNNKTLINFINENNDTNSKPCIVIKYNAWTQDYVEEPFLSLIGQIYSQIKNNINKSSNLKDASQGIVRFLTKACSAISYAGVSVEPEKLKNAATESFRNDIDNFLLEQEQFDQCIKSFKKSLEEVGGKNTLKIIFVDELDRCNPSFAVKTLERLKHFFNIESTIIVITYDRSNLVESIKKVYGNIDAHHYLSRFFNLELQLPKLSSSAIINQMIANKTYPQIKYYPGTILINYCHYFKINPRETIKILNHVNQVLSLGPMLIDTAILLSVLKLNFHEEFEKLSNLDLSINNIVSEEAINTLLKTFMNIFHKDLFKKNFETELYVLFFCTLLKDNEQHYNKIGTSAQNFPENKSFKEAYNRIYLTNNASFIGHSIASFKLMFNMIEYLI